MPRTTLTPATLIRDSSILAPTGTAIDATLVTNGVVIPAPIFSRLLVTVANTAATPKNLTLRAGINPPGSLSSQGNVVTSVVNATTREFGPFTSGRWAQSNGDFYIDFEAGFTGTITARQLPR